MPRVKMGFRDHPRPTAGKLVDRLVDELKSDRTTGQPFIYEQEFSTGKIRALVVWDEWRDVPLEKRNATIMAAYARAESKDYCARITLASGLTVPEALAAGMLPYQIITALRKNDPVTLDQCRQAMLAEGATTLMGPLALRFPTCEAAEACVKRLVSRLPNSDEVWLITKEAASQEYPAEDTLMGIEE